MFISVFKNTNFLQFVSFLQTLPTFPAPPPPTLCYWKSHTIWLSWHKMHNFKIALNIHQPPMLLITLRTKAQSQRTVCFQLATVSVGVITAKFKSLILQSNETTNGAEEAISQSVRAVVLLTFLTGELYVQRHLLSFTWSQIIRSLLSALGPEW